MKMRIFPCLIKLPKVRKSLRISMLKHFLRTKMYFPYPTWFTHSSISSPWVENPALCWHLNMKVSVQSSYKCSFICLFQMIAQDIFAAEASLYWVRPDDNLLKWLCFRLGS